VCLECLYAGREGVACRVRQHVNALRQGRTILKPYVAVAKRGVWPDKDKVASVLPRPWAEVGSSHSVSPAQSPEVAPARPNGHMLCERTRRVTMSDNQTTEAPVDLRRRVVRLTEAPARVGAQARPRLERKARPVIVRRV